MNYYIEIEGGEMNLYGTNIINQNDLLRYNIKSLKEIKTAK